MEREAREEKEAQEKIPSWIERGKKIIYPEREAEWKECVEARASDLYHGEDLEMALQLMEQLEAGSTMEDVMVAFDSQDHSGASAAMVRGILLHFSKKGPEFYERTSFGELTENEKAFVEEKRKENAELEKVHNSQEVVEEHEASEEVKADTEDPFREEKARAQEAKMTYKYGSVLEGVVRELEEYRARGESVYKDFNGVRLYSCDVTMDSAYEAVTGYKKEDFDRMVEESNREYRERSAREEKEAQEKIPSWIERGKKIIYPEREEAWEKCVKARVKDIYHGGDLEKALQLMEQLEAGSTMEEVMENFNSQNHSGASAGMVRIILLHFSKKGPEFFEKTAHGEIIGDQKTILEETKRENAEFERIHNPEKVAEEPEVVEENAPRDLVSSRIAKGEKLLYPERLKEWKEYVERSSNGLYGGMDVDAVIELMEVFENGGTMEDAQKAFDNQNHSGLSYSMVRSLMFRYAKKGPEFYESTATTELSASDKAMIEAKKKENAELEALHGKKEISPERETAEKKLADSASEKGRIKSEIDDIERQIAELRAKQSKLRESLDENSAHDGEDGK